MMTKVSGRSVLGLALLLGGALLLLLALPGGSGVSAAETAGFNCTTPLRVNVRQGPNAGLEAFGLLSLDVDTSGATTGTYDIVTPEALVGTAAVTGQVIGRSVSLVFAFADGSRMFGVGATENPVASCSGDMGGPAIGPAQGDMGDWACTPDYCCGGGVCMVCQLIGSRNVCVRI